MNRSNKLFQYYNQALEKENELCPKCGKELSIKNSKNGLFLGCKGYPQCDYIRSFSKNTHIDEQIIAKSSCPLCKGLLSLKSGRFGMFIGCSNYPNCDYIEKDSEEEKIPCPCCKIGFLKQKTNRFGKLFFSCDNYPKCKYIINLPPVAQTCPKCNFSILLKKKKTGSIVLSCPNKECDYTNE